MICLPACFSVRALFSIVCCVFRMDRRVAFATFFVQLQLSVCEGQLMNDVFFSVSLIGGYCNANWRTENEEVNLVKLINNFG